MSIAASALISAHGYISFPLQLPIAASYNLRARSMHFDCRLKSGVLKELGSRYSRRQAVVVEEHVDSSRNGRPARCPQMQFDQLGVLRSSRPLLVEMPITLVYETELPAR